MEQKTKMNIIELEGNNIMNILSRSVLEMYRFDANADDTSRDNLMRQSIELISKFPTIIAYAYNMLRHATFGVLCISAIRRKSSLLPRISCIC